VSQTIKIKQKCIKDYSLEELQSFMIGIDEPKYRAGQIYRELYGNRKTEFSEFLTLPVSLSEKLINEFIINSAIDFKSQK